MKRQNRVFKIQVDVQTIVLILQILHLFVISDKSLCVGGIPNSNDLTNSCNPVGR